MLTIWLQRWNSPFLLRLDRPRRLLLCSWQRSDGDDNDDNNDDDKKDHDDDDNDNEDNNDDGSVDVFLWNIVLSVRQSVIFLC